MRMIIIIVCLLLVTIPGSQAYRDVKVGCIGAMKADCDFTKSSFISVTQLQILGLVINPEFKVPIQANETLETQVEAEQQEEGIKGNNFDIVQMPKFYDGQKNDTDKYSNENMATHSPEIEQPTENLNNNQQTVNRSVGQAHEQKISEPSIVTNSTDINLTKILDGSDKQKSSDSEEGISVPISEVENQQKNEEKNKNKQKNKDQRTGVVLPTKPPVTGESRLHQGNHLRGIDLDPRRIDIGQIYG